jgi:hypothetical protein
MDRDPLLLLSLTALAAAGFTVGIAGWVLWVRDHRSRDVGRAPDAAHHAVTEDS